MRVFQQPARPDRRVFASWLGAAVYPEARSLSLRQSKAGYTDGAKAPTNTGILRAGPAKCRVRVFQRPVKRTVGHGPSSHGIFLRFLRIMTYRSSFLSQIRAVHRCTSAYPLPSPGPVDESGVNMASIMLRMPRRSDAAHKQASHARNPCSTAPVVPTAGCRGRAWRAERLRDLSTTPA